MKILILSRERRYQRMVKELRKHDEVHYIFKNSQLKYRFVINRGDLHLPILFGFELAFTILAFLFTSFFLLTRNYDICLTDYKCVYLPNIFIFLKYPLNIINTCFIYDIRTIPVNHSDRDYVKIEKQFLRKLNFANAFYQGVTLITEEMKNYLEKKYFIFKVPIGIWESGVDLLKFYPIKKNMKLKINIGFEKNDFLCFYHGSITKKRGVVELVKAFSNKKIYEKNIKLLIIGTGDYYYELKFLISKYDLTDTVKLLNWVDYDRVPEFISIADLCIVPLPNIDWWKVSSPLKLMEYIACGKNILMSRIIAHTNVVGSTKGYFWVDNTIPKNFAQEIIKANDLFSYNPKLFSDNGITIRHKLLPSISWSSRVHSLRNFLSSVLDSNKKASMSIYNYFGKSKFRKPL